MLLCCCAEFGSTVPFGATVALFVEHVPLSTVEVELHVHGERLSSRRPRGRSSFVQVTSWPAAEQRGSEPTVWKVRPAGSVSLTVKPPVLSDGPLFVTVSV